MMFILTITGADGMTYVEAFHEMKKVRAFVPPAWAKMQTPTTRKCVVFTAIDEGPQVINV